MVRRCPCDGKKVACDGKKVACDGKKVPCDGKKVACDGKKVACDGKKVPCDGKKVACVGDRKDRSAVGNSNECMCVCVSAHGPHVCTGFSMHPLFARTYLREMMS